MRSKLIFCLLGLFSGVVYGKMPSVGLVPNWVGECRDVPPGLSVRFYEDDLSKTVFVRIDDGVNSFAFDTGQSVQNFPSDGYLYNPTSHQIEAVMKLGATTGLDSFGLIIHWMSCVGNLVGVTEFWGCELYQAYPGN